MTEALLLLVSSFWLGAVHAATPGHGKTIAAAYIVGARGRPVDAIVLGIFVTLSHTSGIVLVAVLASIGSTWLIPQRVEAYLALTTGVLVILIGLWLFRTQRDALLPIPEPDPGAHAHGHVHEHGQGHPHEHGHGEPAHAHEHETDSETGYHSHGWGARHTHRLNAVADNRPKLAVLLGLGIAGGLLPDPAALAILLAAIASGRVMLGLFTVLVFSIGFAAVLVVVGIVAARVGEAVLTWLSGRWVTWLQMGSALLIVTVGVVLTVTAWTKVQALP
jgi:nickel/cobalt exporter